MSFLEIHNLTKSYAHAGILVNALKDVSFTLERGDTLAVLGPSGAGKSTLLTLIGGLDKPTSGKVLVAERDVHGLSDKQEARFRQESLGFVFQFHHLLQDFTVLENVMLPLLIKEWDRQQATDQAEALLERVGLAGFGSRLPPELSGGEQQRVAIARGLVHRPQIVLADEPTGNLDEANGAAVFDLLCTLNRDLKATLVVVTHHREFSKKLKHCLYLNAGHVESFR